MIIVPAERLAEYRRRGWWGDVTLDDLLQRNIRAQPQRLALVDPPNRTELDGQPPRRYTWQALGVAVDQMAAALLELGLSKGDVISYQLPNVTQTAIVALAASRIGLIISPVVMPYRTHELNYVLSLAEPKAFITQAQFGGCAHAAMALGLDWGGRAPAVWVLGGDVPAGAVDLDRVLADADPGRAARYRAAHPVAPEEVYSIFWTSGTEARPKGVPRDHNLWVVNAKMVAELADLREGEVILCPFPLVNIAAFGLLTPWLWRCGTLVLHHPFDLPTFLGQISAESVNYTLAAPAILNSLLKSEELLTRYDLSSLRAVGSGSAPLSPWMIQRFADDFGIAVCNVYGSNEGAALFSNERHVPNPEDRARYFPRFGVRGLSWEGETAQLLQTRLVDLDTEQDIEEVGRIGELRFQGASTFSGYYRQPELTARAFDAQGFYRTGDLFELAGEGESPRFYRFVGRCKDIIVRGGMNISPAEVDDLLAGHPDVLEAAVVGIPDPELGERMCVAVVPRADVVPDLATITGWLRDKGVAVFKLPERLVVVERLPRNPMNKLQRPVLRSDVLKQLGLDPSP